MSLLDFIFPKKCVGCAQVGAYLCSNCVARIEFFDNQLCCECGRNAIFGATHPVCQKKLGLDGLISLVNYKTPMRELLHNLKYKFVTDLMSEFEQKFNPTVKLAPGNWILLPTPLYWQRQNYRGFNQTELLGKVVADKLKVDFDKALLVKTKPTESQVGLNRLEREANIKNAFAVSGKLGSNDYLVFDDVWTSGATLKSAAQVLKKAGARKVWGLTLARPR